MATAQKRNQRTEYLNVTQGWLGARKINRRGEDYSVTIAPGERVFLTAEERELTEQAHAQAKDSPFVVHEVVHRDPHTKEVVGTYQLCPLEPASSFARSGGKVLPETLPSGP